LNKQNKVTAFGHSFIKTSKLISRCTAKKSHTFIGNIASSTPVITAEQATVIVEKALSATRVDHPTSLEYFVKDDNSVMLTHVVQVTNGKSGHFRTKTITELDRSRGSLV
jgi:extracellular elastinolytic metalloproteinase